MPNFADMDPEERRAIASRGGKAAAASGLTHRWTKEEARVAGRLGGQKTAKDRAHMSEAGRKGGEASGRSKKANAIAEAPVMLTIFSPRK